MPETGGRQFGRVGWQDLEKTGAVQLLSELFGPSFAVLLPESLFPQTRAGTAETSHTPAAFLLQNQSLREGEPVAHFAAD